MVSLTKKLLLKVLLGCFSVALLSLLFFNLDYQQIKNSFGLAIGDNTLLLYVCCWVVSLVARAERYFILHRAVFNSKDVYSRSVILAGTCLRNISMSFLPLRLGELVLPTLLKFTYPKEKVLDSLQPIWISLIFDMGALIVLATSIFIGAHLFDAQNLYLIENKAVFLQKLFILAGTLCVILALFNFTSILKDFCNLKLIRSLSFNFLIIKFDAQKIANQIPSLDFKLNLRVLVLSIIIRLAKYLSLASLFFSLAKPTIPSINNIFSILAAFISAELVASLPGSGVMGFGGYELTFQMVLKLLSPTLSSSLNLITSIHLIGFIVEIGACIIILPLCLLYFRYNKGQKT